MPMTDREWRDLVASVYGDSQDAIVQCANFASCGHLVDPQDVTSHYLPDGHSVACDECWALLAEAERPQAAEREGRA